MLKSSGSMAAATLTSRVLGMVREMVYARFMGDGWVAGAFQFAFTIPNLFRRLLGEGALTAAFIPIFKEKEKTHGEIEMWRAANAVISGLIVAASVGSGRVGVRAGISASVGVSSSGSAGKFQLRLNVYERAGEPCLVCRAPIKTMRQGQRATYYCARCQR